MSDVIVRAKVDEGITVTSPEGRPLNLAVIDDDGRILQSGVSVTKAVFSAAVSAYDAFWQGNGHMTTILRLESK